MSYTAAAGPEPTVQAGNASSGAAPKIIIALDYYGGLTI